MNISFLPTVLTPGQRDADTRKLVIEVLRQQEGLKKKLHELLDQLGTGGRVKIG